MVFDLNAFNEQFEYESPQSLLYKFYRHEPARCSSCGTTYRYFIQTGKLGCAVCFETFKSQLKQDILPRMQRSNHYVGRKYGVPCRFNPSDRKENDTRTVPAAKDLLNASEHDGRQKKREELQHLLKEAVRQENYEEAARLRDRLSALRREKAEGECE